MLKINEPSFRLCHKLPCKCSYFLDKLVGKKTSAKAKINNVNCVQDTKILKKKHADLIHI